MVPNDFLKQPPWAEEDHVGGPNDQQPNGDFAKTSKGIQPDATWQQHKYNWQENMNNVVPFSGLFAILILITHVIQNTPECWYSKINWNQDESKIPSVGIYIYMNNKLDNSPKQGPSFPPQKKYNSVILSHPLSLVGEQRQILQNLPTPDRCYATGSIPSPKPLAGFPVLPVLSSIQHAGQQ